MREEDDGLNMPSEMWEWIKKRASDDPDEHTNLMPRDLEAMRWLLAENEVLRINLKGWHDACNALQERNAQTAKGADSKNAQFQGR